MDKKQRRRMYDIWFQMKERCLNPKNKNFKTYGARGITVCERWMKFENFLADMPYAPPPMSLDRANNALGYSPDNCRWATHTEQIRNSSIPTLYTLGNETLPVGQWEARLGISRGSILQRLKSGWPLEKALTTRNQLH